MKLLITGGAGFIGSNFIRHILHRYPDYQVINLDVLTYAGNLYNLADVTSHPNYFFVKGDICDLDLVDSIIAGGIDVIINFAAESHVDRSILTPEQFVRTNILGTQTLLECAKKYGIQRFIQISTDEVYGSLGESGLFSETTPLAPNSPYSASKAGADLLVRSYYQTYGLPINITRCSNNYGPYQHPEKLIPRMIIQALNDEPLPVYGDGQNIRDWLHVEDHCHAIDLVLHRGKVGEIYNIGGNNEWKNIEIVEKILDYLNKPRTLIQYVEDRLGHDRRYGINATKICKELGWFPQHTFDEGLRSTIEWYVRNESWWNEVRYT